MSELKPGSPEAVAAGCTCPTIDNGHGLGYRYHPDQERARFVRMQTCPLHGWGKMIWLCDEDPLQGWGKTIWWMKDAP